MAQTYDDHLLITIHGVWSDNAGLRRLASHCQRSLPGLHLYHINYGHHGISKVLSEDVRRLIYDNVRLQFLTIWVEMNNTAVYPHQRATKITVAAHSFGTYALFKYLQDPIPGLLIDKVVLMGSILPRHTRWDSVTGGPNKIMHAPVNITRPFDRVVRRARRIHGKRAMSGTRGFSAAGIHIPTDVFKRGGHTAYDPDDHDDVAHIVANAGGRAWVLDENDFVARLSRWERARLKTYRTLGIV